jgi:hypothetical protein
MKDPDWDGERRGGEAAAAHSEIVDLGYVFYPAEDPGSPGFGRVDIILRAAPTKRHFDPEYVLASVRSTQDGVEAFRITHPWHRRCQWHIVPGRVTMCDRVGETVDVFTFGGEMKIGKEGEATVCRINSTAPIFHLIYEPSDLALGRIANLFVAQTEACLAKRRAAWKDDPSTFHKRLASVGPLEIYASMLRALLGECRARSFEHESDLEQDFINFLQGESDRLGDSGLSLEIVPLEGLI